jgi:hypothetical protein
MASSLPCTRKTSLIKSRKRSRWQKRAKYCNIIWSNMHMRTRLKRLCSHYYTLVNIVMTLQVPNREGITRQASQDELGLSCPFHSSYSTHNLQLRTEAVFRIKETKHSYEQKEIMCALLKNKIPISRPGNPKTFCSVRSILTEVHAVSRPLMSQCHLTGYFRFFINSSRPLQLSSLSNRIEY